MRNQWSSGFNSIILWIYDYVSAVFKDETIKNRLSYHNDYDEISIFYAPRVGTNIRRVCIVDLDKLIPYNNDLLENLKINIDKQEDYIKWDKNFQL